MNYEKVDEIKLEVLIDSWKLEKILSAVKAVHPYEEIAYDIYPINNEHTNYGVGAIGETDQPMTQDEFLNHTSKNLGIKNFRYTKGNKNKIKRVAVCGGSGSEYIADAIKKGADAYVTADIKYHSFLDNENKLLLIDAGHYETEIFSLNELKVRLTSFLKENKIKVFKYSKNTNPVNFYNNSGA